MDDEFDEITIGSHTSIYEKEKMTASALRRLSDKIKISVNNISFDSYPKLMNIDLDSKTKGILQCNMCSNDNSFLLKTTKDEVFTTIKLPNGAYYPICYSSSTKVFAFYFKINESRFEIRRFDCSTSKYLSSVLIRDKPIQKVVGVSKNLVYFYTAQNTYRFDLRTGEYEVLDIKISSTNLSAGLYKDFIVYQTSEGNLAKWSVKTCRAKSSIDLSEYITGSITNLHFFADFVLVIGQNTISKEKKNKKPDQRGSVIIALNSSAEKVFDSVEFTNQNYNKRKPIHVAEIINGMFLQVLGMLVKQSLHSKFMYFRLWTVIRKKITFLDVLIPQLDDFVIREQQNFVQIGRREFFGMIWKYINREAVLAEIKIEY